MNRSHRNTHKRTRVLGALALLALLPATASVDAGMPSWWLAGTAMQDQPIRRQIDQGADAGSAPRIVLATWKSAPTAPTSTAPPPTSTPPPPSSVSAVVAWDPNTESDLMGYKLYVGTSSGVYGSPIDVGNFTDYEVRNLEPGRTYYFSVTAYDLSGNESSFSDEISNTLSTASISCTRDASGVLVCSN